MIKLSSAHSMLVTVGGAAVSFDAEQLRRELVHCFEHCGVTETWPVDHVLFILEEQLAEHSESGDHPFTENDVEGLVTSLLVASGYGDVAARFLHLKKGNPTEIIRERFSPFADDRIARLVGACFPLSAVSCGAVARQVKSMLEEVRFSEASDEMIRQLAAHVLHHRLFQEAGGGADDNRDAPDCAGVVEGLPEGVRRHIETGVVAVHPVSPVLPRVRLAIDLSRFGEELGTPPLTELSVLPAFCLLCRDLVPALSALRASVHCAEPDPSLVPSHLVFAGIETLTADLMVPMSRRDMRAFLRELSVIVADEVQIPVDYRVITQIR